MFIEARLATATRANAIVIPEDAIQPLRTANMAWVVDKGKASRRVVQLGVRSAGFVESIERSEGRRAGRRRWTGADGRGNAVDGQTAHGFCTHRAECRSAGAR